MGRHLRAVAIVLTLLGLMASGEACAVERELTDSNARRACSIAWENDREGSSADPDVAGQIYTYGSESAVGAVREAATRYGPAGTSMSARSRWEEMMGACRLAGWKEPTS